VIIEAPDRRISTFFISTVNSSFALWNDEPVIFFDRLKDMTDVSRTAHEMAHAIYDALRRQALGKGPGAARAAAFRLRVADIFRRLGATALTTGGTPHAVGHVMVSQSQWQPGADPEHPWQDPDEFFAAALNGYKFGRPGLQTAIQEAIRLDASVELPANELLELLRMLVELEAISVPTLTPERKRAAEDALRRTGAPDTVADRMTSGSNHVLLLLLDPSAR
jgi:hypothetical protein